MIKNQFIRRQCRCWQWTRAKEYDNLGAGRAWRIHSKFFDHLIGLIWENEL